MELAAEHGLLGISILHRIGEVPPTECSVQILAVSAHRRAAIDAVSTAIDLLKTKVPIWKKEHYLGNAADGKWKENPEFQQIHSKV